MTAGERAQTTSARRRGFWRLLVTPIGNALGLGFAFLYVVVGPFVVGLGDHALLAHIVLFVAFAVAIVIAGRWPLVSLVIVIVMPLLQAREILAYVSNAELYVYAAIFPVAFLIGFTARGVIRYIALGAGLAASAIIAYDVVLFASFARITRPNGASLDPAHPRWLEMAALTPAIFGVYAAVWVFGVSLAGIGLARTLAATEVRLEERDLELRLSEDRARIARDVHDALAHSLTVVVSQAEGGIAVYDNRPELSKEALTTIATVGRNALVDVRRLVERINDHDVVAKRLTSADLDVLLDEMRGVGMTITMSERGMRRPLRTSQDVTLYRIVQESLTNALKHAGASSRTDVAFDWQAESLLVEVASKGDSPVIDTRVGGHGVGIAGMTERAKLAGGQLSAGPRGDGAFVVEASIPYDGGTSTEGIPLEALRAQATLGQRAADKTRGGQDEDGHRTEPATTPAGVPVSKPASLPVRHARG